MSLRTWRYHISADFGASPLLANIYSVGKCCAYYKRGKSNHHSYPAVYPMSYSNDLPGQTIPGTIIELITCDKMGLKP